MPSYNDENNAGMTGNNKRDGESRVENSSDKAVDYQSSMTRRSPNISLVLKG